MLNRKQETILGELISKEVKIIKSNCKDLQDKTGIVIDETTNTLLIQHGTKRFRIPKATCALEINGEIVNGKLLVSKPQDRTKNLSKKILR